MGEVAVMYPPDVLKQRTNYRRNIVRKPLRSTESNRNIPRSKPVTNPNPSIDNKNNNNRRKRSPQKNSSTATKLSNNSNLVMGQVKILKRGEAFTSTTTTTTATTSYKKDDDDLLKEKVSNNNKKAEDLMLSTIDIVPKKISIGDFYAGSAFFTSPPPSSLPLPAFFKKENVVVIDPSSDLRRLLRLDL